MKKYDGKFDLEDRLIDYACLAIDIVEMLPPTKAGNHIGNQLVRSGTSPAPNYGEAQAAESVDDFIHKMKISLKELRESAIWLKIITKRHMIQDSQRLHSITDETVQLISIFMASIVTAKRNRQKSSTGDDSSSR